MRVGIISAIFYLCNLGFCIAQEVDLKYYLPDIPYDSSIPTPEEFLGYQVGDWHVSHDQLYYYMRELAEKSDRVSLREYARSHENRPLVALTITSLDNHKNLDRIKRDHQLLCIADKSKNVNIENLPAVIYQGYSIHGNESSGSNAAMLVAYYLAAGKSYELNNLLEKTVILLDPCLNPDGLHRFSTWANSNKSKHVISDPTSRELNEPWPRGRTNHYWFDLNRDWLLLTHPESRGRVGVFQEWRPNIVTDHHEMGSNSTFFFMPGIPSRTNPKTPHENQLLTGEIAVHHAAILDSIGSLYYTKESFDDYYYGKGSTYPDIQGSIGILFEQASSRGHAQETDHGVLKFPFTIRNQVATSLSTQKAAVELRSKLLSYKRGFFQNAAQEANRSKDAAYVVSYEHDPSRVARFLDILNIHKIKAYSSNENYTINGRGFDKNSSIVIPLQQEQGRLIRAMFERVREFPDSLFYDVSTWTFPMAFDLDFALVSKKQFKNPSEDALINSALLNIRKNRSFEKSDYAYLLSWKDYYSASATMDLLKNGLLLSTSTKKTVLKDGNVVLPGSIIIPVQNQHLTSTQIFDLMQTIAEKFTCSVQSIHSGIHETGVSIGSPSNKALRKPKIALIVGNGTNAYEVGATWHMLDVVQNMEVTLLDTRQFRTADLSRYNTLIMADGNYAALSGYKEKLQKWLLAGGNLVAMRGAVDFLNAQKIIQIKSKGKAEKKEHTHLHYGDIARIRGIQVTGGAILEGRMDLSNPLCFGYADDQVFFFRRGNRNYDPVSNPFATAIRYTAAPLASGYISKENKAMLGNKAALWAHGVGKGQVICFADNPNFRGYWWGTSKLFMNAIFFGDILDRRAK